MIQDHFSRNISIGRLTTQKVRFCWSIV